MVGITAPLSITKGNKIVGGNHTLFALWGAVAALLSVWAVSTDWAVSRLIAARAFARSFLPTVSVRWTGPRRRLSVRRALSADVAHRLVEAGRMSEGVAHATGLDVETTEVGVSEAAFTLRSKAASPAGSRQANATPSPLPTDHEALEMWMEHENIPAEKRPPLRTASAELMQRVAADRAPEHLKHREEANALIEHGGVLEKLLWEHRRVMARSNQWSVFGEKLPHDYAAEVEAWNKRVLALADERLSVRDAGAVAVYPKLGALLVGGPTVKQIESMFIDNFAVLRRIEAMK